MPLDTDTLDYRLYLMALVLDANLQVGKLQAVRVKSSSLEQTHTFSFAPAIVKIGKEITNSR